MEVLEISAKIGVSETKAFLYRLANLRPFELSNKAE
jgi:hypothetical protein